MRGPDADKPEWPTAAWAHASPACLPVCRCCNPTHPTFGPQQSASTQAQQHCKPCDCLLQCRRCSASALLHAGAPSGTPPSHARTQSRVQKGQVARHTPPHLTDAPAAERVPQPSSGSMHWQQAVAACRCVPIGAPTCGGGSAAGPSALDGPAAPAAAPPSRPARAPERPKYSMRGPRPRPSYTSRMRT